MVGRAGAIIPIVAGVALSLALPDRAAAEVCDLREGALTNCSIIGSGAGGTTVTGLFYVDEQHPTGTGVIDSFLRLQQQGSSPTEQGYNTSARSYPLPAPGPKTQFDEKTDPNYTRNLLLTEVETKTINGTVYREFLLDLNEPNSAVNTKYIITLDQLEIFVSNDANLDYYTATGANNSSGSLAYSGGGGSAVKIFDLDQDGSGGGADGYVQLDYRVSAQGSGSSDMAFYLESSLFGSYKYVYLFSQFGDLTGSSNKKYESNGGFEEWFTRSGTLPPPNTAVPEPATLAMAGTGLAALLARRRMRRTVE